MSAARKIVTRHVNPPIPLRLYDWCAYYDGEEEAGDYGWGSTEAAAIADFVENCAEDHDKRLGIVAHSEMHDLAYGTDLLEDHLTNLKGWIEHWKVDAELGLAPTKASLDMAMHRVTSSLKAIERLSKEAAA